MERNTHFLLSELPISQDRPKPMYHDVFLSCSDETRKRLASHLCKALSRSRVQTLVSIDNDDACLKGPRILVVLFSKMYAFSTNRLDELAKAMDIKNSGKLSVLPVFIEVEPYEVKYQAGYFEAAFASHKLTLGNRESVVDRWREALFKAGSLKGWHLKNVSNGDRFQSKVRCLDIFGNLTDSSANWDEAVLVNLVVQKVLSKLNHTPLSIDKKAAGINRCVEEMMVLLDLEVNDVRTVGICGPAGIGKTTIAKAVHNRISGQFDRCVLENIGELSQKPNGLVLLQKKLRGVAGQNDLMIKSKIGSTRMLVLLDGIDRPSQVDALESWKECLGPGSRIIVTTKYESILNRNWVLGIYKPKQSDPIQSIQVLGKHDFYRVCPPDSWEIQLIKHPTRDWTQLGFGVPDKDPLSPEKLRASGILGIYIFFIASLAYVCQIPKSQLLFFSAG